MYSAEPYPHWVIDDFLPQDMAQAAYEHFYDGVGDWIKREHLYCKGKRTRTAGCGMEVEAALAALESPGMLAYISALTGVKDLHADSMRYGGGQHVTSEGGRLGIHADFTHHPLTGMRRALNVLVYLCKDYMPGGSLELWDAQMQTCRVSVPPLWNRAVIFKTSTTSFHGHPEPLRGTQLPVPGSVTEAGVERRSLAAYYYVQDAPGTGSEWLRTTDYRPRPWEYKLKLRKWLSRRIKGV